MVCLISTLSHKTHPGTYMNTLQAFQRYCKLTEFWNEQTFPQGYRFIWNKKLELTMSAFYFVKIFFHNSNACQIIFQLLSLVHKWLTDMYNTLVTDVYIVLDTCVA